MAQREVSILSASAVNPLTASLEDDWRHDNVGRYLNNAICRFELRVFAILDAEAQGVVGQTLLSLTRNLDRGGTRANELARRAGMTRQAMSELIAQAEILGIVSRTSDPSDARAKVVLFTKAGLAWLDAFHRALDRASAEMTAELGDDRFAALLAALRQYGGGFDALRET